MLSRGQTSPEDRYRVERRKPAADSQPMRIALIGAGKFGSMFLSQAHRTPGMHVVAVADLALQRGAASCPGRTSPHWKAMLPASAARWKWRWPINNDQTLRARARSFPHPLELSLRVCGGTPGVPLVRTARIHAAGAPVFQENAKPYA
jgi:hypothetical protein